MIRTYREMSRLTTFLERFEYLKLSGRVGHETFGYDRWINQNFYRSTQWKNIRSQVIARDLGCDLGIEGYEIHDRIYIHHMNPMVEEEILGGDPAIINPNFLITTNHRTHNAIHYGDASGLLVELPERKRGDTRLW